MVCNSLAGSRKTFWTRCSSLLTSDGEAQCTSGGNDFSFTIHHQTCSLTLIMALASDGPVENIAEKILIGPR